MRTREETAAYCLTLPDVYADTPFRDENWTVIRCRGNRKVFAWIFEREGTLWLNVKMRPEWRDFWREAFEAVIPAYHLNKEHWSSVILNGTVPEKDVRRMIEESYDLVKPDLKKSKAKNKKAKNTKENG